MTVYASTGLRDQLMVQGSLREVLASGRIDIYAGTVPANADASIGSATLLCRMTQSSSGVGITLSSTSTSGSVPKAPGEVWSGVNVAAGTATFFRHVLLTDDGGASTTQPRLQGAIGVSGSDMNFSAGVVLTLSATTVIDSYSVAQPT